jgi:hypothetical protein
MNPETTGQKPQKPKRSKKRIVLGIVIFILGLLILSAGISILYYNIQDTDSEGYTYSDGYYVNTSTYAYTMYMNAYSTATWGFLGPENVAQIKFIATNTNPAKELFIGYATTEDSTSYSDSFQCEIPTYWRYIAKPYNAEIIINTTMISGDGAPADLPQTQTFWLTSDQSATTAEMTYLPQHEQHVWFIMNSDGSRNVTAVIQIAFKSPLLTILPFILLPIAILLIVVGIYLLRRKKISQEKKEKTP